MGYNTRAFYAGKALLSLGFLGLTIGLCFINPLIMGVICGVSGVILITSIALMIYGVRSRSPSSFPKIENRSVANNVNQNPYKNLMQRSIANRPANDDIASYPPSPSVRNDEAKASAGYSNPIGADYTKPPKSVPNPDASAPTLAELGMAAPVPSVSSWI